MDQRRGETLLAQAHIPKDYLGCSFESFTRLPGTGTAYELATRWSRSLRTGEIEKPGLLLRGPSGSGKTHLSVAIVREFVFAKFSPALFLNVPEWLNETRTAFQAGESRNIPSPRGFPLVVVDDLGTERGTPWTADQIYSLINHRESNSLPTVVTTNLAAPELEQRLGRATMSRLTRLCRSVPLTPSTDFREQHSLVN